MSIESFLILKEIDSLSKMRNAQIAAKSNQENRLASLNTRKKETLENINLYKERLISKHSEMADIEKKLKTSTEQMQRLIDLGGDENKIKIYSDQIALLENEGLNCLSDTELLETEIREKKIFLQGLEKTIEEIQKEVEEEIATIQKEISNLDLRLNLLKNDLPDDFKAVLKSISSKNLAHGPFTRIENGSCYFCRFKISRMDESEIDMQKNLKTCPQCTRIFLPYGS